MIIVGLDGASIENITRLYSKTDMPNFQKLLRDGSCSNLKSIYPYVTAPAWTSIFSGVNPGKHGIFDMYSFRERKMIPSNIRNSDIPFLWDYLSWAKKRVLVMGVPFAYPAPNVNGAFITGRFVPKLSYFPSSLAKKADLSGYAYNDIGTEEQIEEFLREGTQAFSEQLLLNLEKRIEATLTLFDSEKWDLAIFVDNLPDELFHISYLDDNIQIRMFQLFDKWLGHLIGRLQEGDLVLVVSDHGYGPIQNVFFINEWLRSKKYLKIPQPILAKLMMSIGFNWDSMNNNIISTMYRFALRHFPLILSYLKNRIRGGFFVEGDQTLGAKALAHNINEPVAWIEILDKVNPERAKTEIIRDLNDLMRAGIVHKILETNKLYHGKYMKQALGQILVECNEHFSIDSTRIGNGQVIGKPLLTKQGAHKLNGIIISYGNFQTRMDPTPELYDIVPSVLQVLRLPSPTFLDGRSIYDKSEDIGSTLRVKIRQLPEPSSQSTKSRDSV